MRVIRQHRTPEQVQAFLRAFPYNFEEGGETCATFRGAVRSGKAHCLEAALVAATILERHGYPPLLLSMESQDQLDHVVWLYRSRGRWGSVGRSRDPGLQGRKAVFRRVRDLVYSYVDAYVDGSGRVTGYGVADLRQLRGCDWRLSSRNVWKLERYLIDMPHRRLKTSDRRYREYLRRYRRFRRLFPDRRPQYFRNKHQWL